VTFNVGGPTNINVVDGTGASILSQPPKLAPVYVRNYSNQSPLPAGPVLQLGKGADTNDNTQKGIVLTPSATMPASDGGNFVWVQLLNKDIVRSILQSTTQTATLISLPPPLDARYPAYYGTLGSNQAQFWDSPDVATSPEVARNFAATTYLMWDPSLPAGCTPGVNCTSSIPVPLGTLTWQWSGDGIDTLSSTLGQNGSTSILNYGGSSASQLQLSSPCADTMNYCYPTWKTVIPTGVSLCSNHTCTSP